MRQADVHRHILLVEDRHAAGTAAGPILEQAGYRVDQAADGPGAVQAAATGRYDLIMLDLGGDGVETTGRIRRLPYPEGDVRILGLTGTAIERDQDRYYGAGVDGLLAMPIDPLALLEAVAHWVEAVDDPNWGLETRPGVTPPLLNRRSLVQLEEDVGSELFLDVIKTFLEESERRLGLLTERVDAGDATGAADQAHALKGSAGTFGAMALRQCVHEMELAGRAAERGRLAVLLPQAGFLLGATCNQLRLKYPLAAS